MEINPFARYEDGFVRESFTQEFKSHPTDLKAHIHFDEVNTYRLNSDGYRSDEFIGLPKLVVAGCSFTFGSGVSEEQSWGSIVANTLGVEHHNLGVCAWSTQAIIYNLFAYFKKYGNPETLICLFPDDSRLMLPMVRGFVEHPDWNKEHGDNYRLLSVMIPRRDIAREDPYHDMPKYSKRPHNWEEILPVEMSMHQYIQYIHMLQQYCKVAGINFKWSTWYRPLADMLEDKEDSDYPAYIRYGLDTYTPLGASEWSWDCSIEGGAMVSSDLEKSKLADCSCHSELRDADGDYFYIGTDGSLNELHHWGSHKHAHIAEAFLGALG